LGRFHWNKRTAADLASSAKYYQQAIDRDPNYAPAYAGLANAYALMPSYDSVDVRDSYVKAAAAARRALALDDTLAEAHATLGLIALNWAPDWLRAEPELRRALELNPSYATAHHWFAFHLIQSERRSEALAEMEAAHQLDPLSAIINADHGELLYSARLYPEARLKLRQAIELEPNFGQPHQTLALIELETGDKADAVKEARAALALDPNNPATMGRAGYVLAACGQTADAAKLLATLNDMVRRGSAYPMHPALVDMGLRQRNEALEMIHEPWKWRDTFPMPFGKQPKPSIIWPR
jgi:tetratricopeptide (TPR) repeat protein